MAGLKFQSFGAATMPLSKVVVDTDLDLKPNDLIVNDIVATSIRGYIDPSTWNTEVFPWPPDNPPSLLDTQPMGGHPSTVSYQNTTSDTIQIYVTITFVSGYFLDSDLYINGTKVQTITKVLPGTPATTNSYWVNPSELVEVRSTNGTGSFTVEFYSTGKIGIPYTHNLQDKLLALGINFGGLTATLSLFGNSVSYNDYALYFPLKPESITITGSFTPRQRRPIILVYTE